MQATILTQGLRAALLGAVLVAGSALPSAAAATPKHGGILTYMFPADAPPSFDAHRETTYALVHTIAPFYSVLIRLDPSNPSDTTHFYCDLCTEMPTPTDGGKTYTFKIRQGVTFQDGSPLTAADVAATWNAIISPPEGVSSARDLVHDGGQGCGTRRDHGGVPSEIRHHGLSAGARRSVRDDLREEDPRKGPALVREERDGFGAVLVHQLRPWTVDQGDAQPQLLPQGAALS